MRCPRPTAVGTPRVRRGRGTPLALALALCLASGPALADRGEEIRALQDTLAAAPGDGDTRVRLGAMLSWEGRYDEARQVLAPLLLDPAPRGDAVQAAFHVELWSGHLEAAEGLAAAARAREPRDATWLLLHARALHALGRREEALSTLDVLLDLSPGHPEARAFKEQVRAESRAWEAAVGATADTFSDGRSPWLETEEVLSRRTGLGSVYARHRHAWRYGLQDDQGELEWYPTLGSGTWGYVEVAVSPAHRLYPLVRYAVDLNRTLPRAWEVSGGFRQLWFVGTTPTRVDLLTVSGARYQGSWYLVGRLYLVPTSPSGSLHVSARYYLGDQGTWVGARYGHGLASEALQDELSGLVYDVSILASDTLAVEGDAVFLGRWHGRASGALTHQSTLSGGPFYQATVSSLLGVRF